MNDPEVDRFFEETVERSLRDYAEEGVTTETNAVEITREASVRAASGAQTQPPRTSWLAVALGTAIALALLLLGLVTGLVKLPTF